MKGMASVERIAVSTTVILVGMTYTKSSRNHLHAPPAPPASTPTLARRASVPIVQLERRAHRTEQRLATTVSRGESLVCNTIGAANSILMRDLDGRAHKHSIYKYSLTNLDRTFSSSNGSSTCESCPVGKFSDVSASACKVCPPGKRRYSDAPGCEPCAPGTFTEAEDSTVCVSCGRGRYSSTTGASSCHLCPHGKYGGASGMQECALCPAGTKGPILGALKRAQCVDCSPGTFSETPGATICKQCEEGRTNKGNASTECFSVSVATPSSSSPSPSPSPSLPPPTPTPSSEDSSPIAIGVLVVVAFTLAVLIGGAYFAWGQLKDRSVVNAADQDQSVAQE